ncbi:nuclease-related domain-containing protein [Oceanobacillus picturae]|uniref:nuclease-related domain-containing protein n=1 Tax=Oceanobacillus picturae TaxID=171693 RepID=UPI000E678CA1|nr:nuclease-related domain-containing protein [Oceanobacillus picturae]RIU94884.1 NERD domain-containing protein [Oceanobacillus picturae]
MKGGINLISKPRLKSYQLLAYEALYRKLKKEYKDNEIFLQDYGKYYAGFLGEKRVDYTLSNFREENIFIIKDLRLNNYNNYFQIDTLLITPYNLVILEVKNFKGELSYDSLQKQFTQQAGGKKTVYKDPIQQANTQKRNLAFWLQNFSINMPIDTLVVSSNPATSIHNLQEDPQIYNQLIHSESLHFHLERIFAGYSEQQFNHSSQNKLYKLLLSHHQPLIPNLIEYYKISPDFLISGVPCDNCPDLVMHKRKNKWICPKCKRTSASAHRQVILDHFLLFKNTITNLECRKLLNISSPRSAYLLLIGMSLKYSGKNRARKYYSPPLETYPQDNGIPFSSNNIFL